ncbi:tRNA 2-thiouridine(34) synthase MnmA [Candidatus Parcubacteria bacterium]|nr:tRNA 2-thiouridine(34) synthase MnmA [Candidatus Parcubacteria bacterium]
MNTSGTKKNISDKGRVFVGLSGGVDSAVSAALLKEQGYDVTGVFIKAWQPDWMVCTWREERRDAMRVALALDIPFLFLDMEKEYKQGVVDKMIAEYKANRTPNPDVLCNREIKFGSFWNKAKELGADFIATGHYAKVFSKQHSLALYESKDKEKDQSYFLWTLTQEDLEHTLFPVGGLEKKDVRELAKKFKLPVAEKKDSQGICFLGDVSMEDFLSHYIDIKPGKVVNTDGQVIGTHKGLPFYTIGERHGFEVTKKSADSSPFYIVAKDVKTNALVVSNDIAEIKDLSPQKVVLKNVNWIHEPLVPELTARIRYHGGKLPCKLSLEGKKLAVEFTNPVRGLALGQSIVFYSDEECLGGAVMDRLY